MLIEPPFRVTNDGGLRITNDGTPRIAPGPESFLNLTGAVGTYASAPNSAGLTPSGDCEFLFRGSLASWRPASINSLLTKYDAGQRSFSFIQHTTNGGVLCLTTSTDGASGVDHLATVSSPMVNGVTYWVRATLKANNGAGGHDVEFFYAADSETIPIAWTKIGATVTRAGVVSLFNGSSAIQLGTYATTSGPANGKFRRCVLVDGIGGRIVFDADISKATAGASSFREIARGALVTLNGAASIQNLRYSA